MNEDKKLENSENEIERALKLVAFALNNSKDIKSVLDAFQEFRFQYMKAPISFSGALGDAYQRLFEAMLALSKGEK